MVAGDDVPPGDGVDDVPPGVGGVVVGDGKLQGLLPLEQTTLQARVVCDDEEPGLEMAVVNCGV